MTGEPSAPAPRLRRKSIFGPEPWQEVAGRTWSHWDLWYCVVLMSDFDGHWAAFSEELWRRRSPYLLTLDEEAKVSHLEDLRARLADAGLGPADLVGAAAGDRKLLAKARRKVLEQPLDRGRDLTSAMRATPRERLWCRAMHGHWERFPVSPASAHARFADQVMRARGRGRGGYGIAQALQPLLDDQDRRLTGDPAARLALWRGLLTAGVEALGEVRDRDGSSPASSAGRSPPTRGCRGSRQGSRRRRTSPTSASCPCGRTTAYSTSARPPRSPASASSTMSWSRGCCGPWRPSWRDTVSATRPRSPGDWWPTCRPPPLAWTG